MIPKIFCMQLPQRMTGVAFRPCKNLGEYLIFVHGTSDL